MSDAGISLSMAVNAFSGEHLLHLKTLQTKGHAATTRSRSSRPFAEAAETLMKHGLHPIPLTGKKPAVKGFGAGTQRASGSTVKKWVTQFASKNVGILCGKHSGIVVLDFDGVGARERALALATPMVIGTPSGGAHAWFRYKAEPNTTFRALGLGFDGDLKAEGSYVVVPPSVGPNGRAYNFLKGGWESLQDLPPIPAEFQSSISAKASKVRAPVQKGSRNTTLFSRLLVDAHHCDDLDALLDCARTHNESFVPSLSDAEVLHTAESVWGYQEAGRNFHSRDRFATLTLSEVETCTKYPDALALLTFLRAYHSPSHVFAVSPRALAARLKWGDPRRIAKARDYLMQCNLIVCLHKGGSRPGDKSQYHLAAHLVRADLEKKLKP